MRVRGLKLHFARNCVRSKIVAPHAGAWIETSTPSFAKSPVRVAPHAGAWIETASTLS